MALAQVWRRLFDLHDRRRFGFGRCRFRGALRRRRLLLHRIGRGRDIGYLSLKRYRNRLRLGDPVGGEESAQRKQAEQQRMAAQRGAQANLFRTVHRHKAIAPRMNAR